MKRSNSQRVRARGTGGSGDEDSTSDPASSKSSSARPARKRPTKRYIESSDDGSDQEDSEDVTQPTEMDGDEEDKVASADEEEEDAESVILSLPPLSSSKYKELKAKMDKQNARANLQSLKSVESGSATASSSKARPSLTAGGVKKQLALNAWLTKVPRRDDVDPPRRESSGPSKATKVSTAPKKTPKDAPKKPLPKRAGKEVVAAKKAKKGKGKKDDSGSDFAMSGSESEEDDDEEDFAIEEEEEEESDAEDSDAMSIISEEVSKKKKKSLAGSRSNTMSSFLGKKLSPQPTKSKPRKSAARKSDGNNLSKKEKETIDEYELAPISDVPEMFVDMMRRNPDFEDVAKHLDGRKLKVATMCSGTESPLLALGMISKAVKQLWNVDFRVEHVFSCEIEPFKQAYIERNFQPPILFRDVCELGDDEATTAYGAKVKVPGGVDMLVAGTSCVDYSNLNNQKKDIDQKGESGRTFHGMLEWVRKTQPSIVLLENVCSAPWDKVVEKFEAIDYDAEWSRFDTKHYYIPHTRTRVYLVATPKGLRKKGETRIPQAWLSMVNNMARPASVPLEAFMYSVDDPRIHEARRQLAYVRESKDGQGRSATDWGRCESRHARARAEEELGDKRPLTAWQDGPVCKMLDGGWDDWANAQTERVVDLMDINTLRQALLGVDAYYKTLVWNLSQNVDRTTGSGKLGIAPCLTPNMIPYVTNRGGPLIGREALSLQGIPTTGLLLTKESEDQLADLAGNAMSTTVVGSSMIAALLLTFDQLEAGTAVMDVDEPADDDETPISAHVADEDKLHQAPLDLSTTAPISDGFLARATASARLCVCEGRSSVSQHQIKRCQDCGHTSCVSCNGRPEHRYEDMRDERVSASKFEAELKSVLPMRLSIEGFTEESLAKVEADAAGLDIVPDDWALLKEQILDAIPGKEFHFRALKRQQVWVAVFDAPRASLELRLDPLWPEWRLSVKPEMTAPIKCPARLLLNSPVARLSLSGDSKDLLAGTWDVRLPVEKTFKLQVKGTGDVVPGWSKALGLVTEVARGDDRWSAFEITAPAEAKNYLDRDLDGVWELHADCGTAQNSLHRKVASPEESDLPPLFLFLDPTRAGEVKEDGAVFSIDHSRLDYGVSRPTVATADTSWRPNAKPESTMTCNVFSKWIASGDPTLSANSASVAVTSLETTMHALPTDALDITIEAGTCRSSTALVTCKVPLPQGQEDPVWGDGDWREVDLAHDGDAVFESIAWVMERTPAPTAVEAWTNVKDLRKAIACQRCAPKEPEVEWVQDAKGRKWLPLEDVVGAGKYEQALKRRPAPFVMQLRNVDGFGQFRLGINIATLVHRAAARFPERSVHGRPSLSWHVELHHDGSLSALRRTPLKFKLLSNKNDSSYHQPPHFKNKRAELRPEQLRSLSWMVAQERLDSSVTHTFVEEEVAEAVLEPLGWRAEGKAERQVLIRGGVLADQVGYGKTAITIGLIDETLKEAKKSPPEVPAQDLEGRVRSHATLVVVPAHLTSQWPSEFEKFTGKDNIKVLRIINMAGLNKVTIEDILNADVVIVSETLLSADLYWSNLAHLAGISGFPKDAEGGRFFRACFDEAMVGLRKQTAVLTDEEDGGAAAMLEAIDQAHEARAEAKAAAKTAQSKRLKGAAYAAQHAVREDSDDDEPPSKKAKNAKGNAKPKPGKKQAHGGDVWRLTERETRQDWRQMHCPPLHMFHWHRRVIDEYTYLKGTIRAAVGGIGSWSTWVLSGTPPVANFAEIKSIANLLHVHLGIDDDAEGDKESAKAREKQQTAAERFHSFREMRTAAWHHRRDEVAQSFLDRFVRQNVAEIDEIPCVIGIDVIGLPAPERAIYLELEHHIMSLDMNAKKVMRKAKAGAADRESRYAAVLGNSRSPEEALLKRCSHFTTDLSSDSSAHLAAHAGAACTVIHDERSEQLDQCVREIRQRIKQAAALYRKTLREGSYEGDDRKPPFQDYLRESNGNIGDSEAGEKLREILEELECSLENGSVKVPTLADDDSDLEDVLENLNPELFARKQSGDKKKGKDDKPKAASEETKKARKWAAREACHVLRRLSKELVGRYRSARYFAAVRDVQMGKMSTTIRVDDQGREVPDTTGGRSAPRAILSTCGHSGPFDSVFAAARAQECWHKGLDGCTAPARETSVVRADSLGTEETSGRFGIKLERLAWHIHRIPETERVLIFTQFDDLIDKVEAALEYRGIGVARVRGSALQRAKILTAFQENEDKDTRVLLLHATDASASGANLTGANWAFFVSPLLLPSADKYRACETQAIGRLQRYGQRKTVNIVRLLVDDSIDTTVYAHRHELTAEALKAELDEARAAQKPFEVPRSPTKKAGRLQPGEGKENKVRKGSVSPARRPKARAGKKKAVIIESSDEEEEEHASSDDE